MRNVSLKLHMIIVIVIAVKHQSNLWIHTYWFSIIMVSPQSVALLACQPRKSERLLNCNHFHCDQAEYFLSHSFYGSGDFIELYKVKRSSTLTTSLGIGLLTVDPFVSGPGYQTKWHSNLERHFHINKQQHIGHKDSKINAHNGRIWTEEMEQRRE